jgi:SanA protein
MRLLKKITLFTVLGIVAFFLLSNIWVVQSTKDKVFFESTELPNHRVGLVLGTSHRLLNGKPNPFFQKRIEMAAALYNSGKVDNFILSGDNRSVYYNEPVEMQKALIKLGVPATAITLDYAGLRTLDSIVRSKEIFGQDKLIIITQPFHSYRAVFIGRYYNIDAVAMVADEPTLESSLKVRIREYFARSKAVLDLYIFNTSPRFLGEKEELNS